jgi:hypothetical protein
MRCFPRSYAAMIEHHVFVVAEDIVGFVVLEDLEHLVPEPVFKDGIAGTQQLIDRAHALERQLQPCSVAMDIRNNAYPHSVQAIGSTPRFEVGLAKVE